MRARDVLGAAGIAAGAAAGVVAGACALVAPRRGGEGLEGRWAELCRHRYAHRGLHAEGIPENSLTAFAKARELGFGVELDVHLTLDGELVVIHDSSLGRVCGRSGVVEQLTLAELGECRLMGTDEGVPTLDEVLRLFDASGDTTSPAPPVIVELKTADGNAALLAERTMACVDRYDLSFCVESFDPRALGWLRAHRPDVLRGQLVRSFLGDKDLSLARRLGATALLGNVTARPDFIACRFRDRGLPAVRLACGRLGAHLVTWTIHSEREMLESEAEGAPVIFEGFIPDPRSTIGGEARPD